MHMPFTTPTRRPCRLCGAEDLATLCFLDGLEIVRCRQCGFAQMGPPFDLARLKTRYAGTGETTVDLRAEFDQRKIQRGSRFRADYVQKHTGLKAGRLLEVGSAHGHFLAVMQERGFEVLGVEPGREGALRHREKGLPVINDLLENADLPEASFDAIVMFQVFEHFEEPKEAARLLHAKLRPGGYLVVEVPDIFSVGARFEKQAHKLFKDEHISYFSRDTLTALLTGAGFAPVWVHHVDYDPFRLPYAQSLVKIFKPALMPRFPGLLDRLLAGEMDVHIFRPSPAPGPGPAATLPSAARQFSKKLKNFRRMLTAPLDICLGYLAYRLDRGASLAWIGRKAG
jgi:SAM-dependent methyltransferase